MSVLAALSAACGGRADEKLKKLTKQTNFKSTGSKIFDAFCHWFDEVGGRLVNQCFSNYSFRLCWLGCIENCVWLNWGDCMRILSDNRLRKFISEVGKCSGIAHRGVDDRR
jgi:hypothetical protein